jgi:hypothetical protein
VETELKLKSNHRIDSATPAKAGIPVPHRSRNFSLVLMTGNPIAIWRNPDVILG